MPDASETRQDSLTPLTAVMTAVSRLVVTTEALAAVGARAAESGAGGKGMPPAVAASVDAVLSEAGVPDPAALPESQRAMVAAYVRSAFAQAGSFLNQPARPAGWLHTDPVVLEGQGRSSMPMPSLLAKLGVFGEVRSFLDIGTGVGWLAVGATQVWPDAEVVGIDVWEPAIERARANVAGAGLGDRIEIRQQDVLDLDDRDRFDLTWLPSFFVAPHVLGPAFGRILAATRPGGQIAVAQLEPDPDPLANAALRMRTVRDGGSWVETEEILRLLRGAGWADARVVPKNYPARLLIVAARKAAS